MEFGRFEFVYLLRRGESLSPLRSRQYLPTEYSVDDRRNDGHGEKIVGRQMLNIFIRSDVVFFIFISASMTNYLFFVVRSTIFFHFSHTHTNNFHPICGILSV